MLWGPTRADGDTRQRQRLSHRTAVEMRYTKAASKPPNGSGNTMYKGSGSATEEMETRYIKAVSWPPKAVETRCMKAAFSQWKRDA